VQWQWQLPLPNINIDDIRPIRHLRDRIQQRRDPRCPDPARPSVARLTTTTATASHTATATATATASATASHTGSGCEPDSGTVAPQQQRRDARDHPVEMAE
jgi:hypothetical protein